MSFYVELQNHTAVERQYLLSAPVIEYCRSGNINASMYISFLTQAFYHVSHTVPLLMAAGSRLNMDQEWVRGAIAEYIDEEYGHQEWILDDITACGGDANTVRKGRPGLPIELMISFLYDQINRANPMAIFGMVQVLEGTSVAIATTIAGQLETGLGLPAQATRYLSSHGSLDKEHLKFFEKLMNKVDKPNDCDAIIHAAKVVYQLYGDMLRSITEPL
ncbi:iron-containing redox enzyme family protein [Acerihabitans sp. TG2]|uniref:TenA family transcriptional regulator n=1 Tax=Acerihabitans sp. TG2 TaxID=3096008 RepID=UPI002B23DF75|nr:iron-containing redox enzyme family protein [Acerihabitans sp. TG2]MEA9393267.1 iron-containing redox enzyme family protein [Acerihabitans sp. TG2]